MMCLAVPARIVELEGSNVVVEIGGVRRAGNVAFIEDPKIGDYVLLHAGFAIRKWSSDDVRVFNAMAEEMNRLDVPEEIEVARGAGRLP